MDLMKHYVLFKYKKGYLTGERLSQIADTFYALREALPDEVQTVSVTRNCVSREKNMDLMVSMSLTDELSLKKYLEHPLHVALVKETMPYILEFCSFDTEERDLL